MSRLGRSDWDRVYNHVEGRPNFDPGGQGTVQTGRGTPHAQHQPSRQDRGEDRGPRRVRDQAQPSRTWARTVTSDKVRPKGRCS